MFVDDVGQGVLVEPFIREPSSHYQSRSHPSPTPPSPAMSTRSKKKATALAPSPSPPASSPPPQQQSAAVSDVGDIDPPSEPALAPTLPGEEAAVVPTTSTVSGPSDSEDSPENLLAVIQPAATTGVEGDGYVPFSSVDGAFSDCL